MARAEETTRAVSKGDIAIFNLYCWVRFAAQLTDCFNHFGDAASVCRMVVAQTTAVCIEGELTDTRNQIAIGDEFSAFTLFTEAQVFKLHNDGDREAVIDRRIFDILMSDACFFESGCTRKARSGVGEINMTAKLTFYSFART